MKKVMSGGEKKLLEIFELFSKYYSLGILPFIAEAEMPDDAAICEMLAARRAAKGIYPAEYIYVQGGQNIPAAELMTEQADSVNAVIRKAGGAENIRKAFKRYEREHPDKYNIVKDFLLKDLKELDNLEEIAERNGYSSRWIGKKKIEAWKDVVRCIELEKHSILKER
ncbi:MAG: hypothetical protein Q4E34_05935 [Synergistaceae bacterium]|nr:hypothetical protein [Synergistaceae bacterium]